MKRDGLIQENKVVFEERVGGFLYTVAVVSVLFISLIFSSINLEGDLRTYLSYLLPPLAVLFAIFVTFKYNKISFCPTLKLFNFGFKKRYCLVILLLVAGMLFGMSELNNIFIEFLSKFGYKESDSSLPSLSVISFILCTVIIAVLAPVMEEYLFRGVIQQSIGRFSKIAAIFLTAGLFSIYHMSPAKTIYQFAVGIPLSLVCLKSGSLIPSFLVHFLNNFLVILNFYFNIFGFLSENRIIFTVIGLICLGGALALMLTDKDESFKTEGESGEAYKFILPALGGVLGCLAVWIAGLI